MSGPMQWTPNGLVPAMTSASSGTIGAASPRPLDEFDDEDDTDEGVEVVPRAVKPVKQSAKPITPVAPKNIVRMARARLVEIERELKKLRRLERERDELRRLVDAANPKPRAVVRELTKRSAG
jgi:hypothetical protein